MNATQREVKLNSIFRRKLETLEVANRRVFISHH